MMTAGKTLILSLTVMSAFIAVVTVVAYQSYNATELPDTIQPELIEQAAESRPQTQEPQDTPSGGNTGNTGTVPSGVNGSYSPDNVVRVEGEGLRGLDVGFLKSIKYVYSERYLRGYIIDVARVGVEGYCTDCVVLFTLEGRDGDRYYVLVYGRWYLITDYEDEEEHEEYGARILSIDGLEEYIVSYMNNSIPVKVEVVESNLEYNGSRVYIGYEIKPYGQDIELVSATIEEYEEHD